MLQALLKHLVEARLRDLGLGYLHLGVIVLYSAAATDPKRSALKLSRGVAGERRLEQEAMFVLAGHVQCHGICANLMRLLQGAGKVVQ